MQHQSRAMSVRRISMQRPAAAAATGQATLAHLRRRYQALADSARLAHLGDTTHGPPFRLWAATRAGCQCQCQSCSDWGKRATHRPLAGPRQSFCDASCGLYHSTRVESGTGLLCRDCGVHQLRAHWGVLSNDASTPSTGSAAGASERKKYGGISQS